MCGLNVGNVLLYYFRSVIFSNAFMLLLLVGLVVYFPHHLAFLQRRTMYYLLGQDGADMSVTDSIQQLFTGWSWNSTLPSLISVPTREL